MTTFLRAVAGCAIVVMLMICCGRSQAGSPIIVVTGDGDGSGYVFSFAACKRPDVELPINLIKVIEPGTDPDNYHNVCELAAIDKYGVPIKRWTYGKAPTGFRLISACEPLTMGSIYEIVIVGAGVGGRQFTIRNDGKIRWLEEQCR